MPETACNHNAVPLSVPPLLGRWMTFVSASNLDMNRCHIESRPVA